MPTSGRTPRRWLLLCVVMVAGFWGGALVFSQGAQGIEDVQILQVPGGPVPMPMPRDTMPPRAITPAGTATVSGSVLSADGGRPVRRATVRLAGLTPGGPPLSTTTDDQGRFAFEKVAAGQFTLTASKPGYLDSIYGQRRAGSGRPGTPLSVAEGQRVERLSVPIARGGVLAGIVTDDGGEPAFGTSVSALRYVWQDGERALQVTGSVRADDRGGYRIGALPPGDYVVMATPAGEANTVDVIGGPMPAGGGGIMMAPVAVFTRGEELPGGQPTAATNYAPVYYPGAASTAGATTIPVDVGEERNGLDIQMPLVPMGRISGIVANDGTRPLDGVEVRLVTLEEPVTRPARAAFTDAAGRFSFQNVAPGRYQVLAHSGMRRTIIVDQQGGGTRVTAQFMRAAPGPGGPFPLDGPGGPAAPPELPALSASADIVVTGRDVENVSLMLQPGTTVSGRIVFDGTGKPPADLRSIRLVLNTSVRAAGGPQSALGSVNADGTFTIADVAPGTYRVAALAGPGWSPKSFDVMGRDALDFLLDVQPGRAVTDAVLTLTSESTRLGGTLQEASGQTTSAYTIVVFADDQSYWTPQSRRIRATRPATDGRFGIGGLPAGRYLMAALEDLEDGRWFDPAFLRQIASAAIPIALADGEQRTQDIRVAR